MALILTLDKYYSGHDPEQHLRGFSHRSDSLCNNAGDIVTFEPYNSKST